MWRKKKQINEWQDKWNDKNFVLLLENYVVGKPENWRVFLFVKPKYYHTPLKNINWLECEKEKNENRNGNVSGNV